ncbi:hypothetical protein C8J28_12252 [Cereibacter azotoformans]|uniref:Uncharacterized protein n=1 Tax=Cereibacter azotoformans TaxID=43057 RepID=A0A2T5JTC8_9RHOB|nr:hypothetical protein C8J28_12252 [Cereibacter azotoformans]
MSRSPPSRSPVPSVPDGKEEGRGFFLFFGGRTSEERKTEEAVLNRREQREQREHSLLSLLGKVFPWGTPDRPLSWPGTARAAPLGLSSGPVARCRMAERPEGRSLASLGEPWRQPAGPGSRGAVQASGGGGIHQCRLGSCGQGDAHRAFPAARARMSPLFPPVSQVGNRPRRGHLLAFAKQSSAFPPVPSVPGRKEGEGTGVFLWREQSGRTEGRSGCPAAGTAGTAGTLSSPFETK